MFQTDKQVYTVMSTTPAKRMGGHRAPRKTESDVQAYIRVVTTAMAAVMVGNMLISAML